jgi:hypothetical protein
VVATSANVSQCEALPSRDEWQEVDVVTALGSVPVEHERPPRASGGASSTLAVVLRGDMRGDIQDSIDCADSVMRSFIQPCALQQPPCAVDVFGVVFPEQQALTSSVTARFGDHFAQLVSMTKQGQQTTVVGAVRSVLEYERRHGLTESYYDALVVTRWDLHFKMDMAHLLGVRGFLGAHAQPAVGILWHEVDSATPPNAACPSNQCSEALKHPFPTSPAELATHTRVPDDVSTVSRTLARCFMSMVQTLAPAAAGHDLLTTSGQARHVRYLLPCDVFDSNPIRCLLNPVYDMLPRNRKMVDAGLCQAPADFTLDAHSQTSCCPAPGYCCPHTALGCSTDAVAYDGALSDCA